jgi:hypothetical protein
MTVVLLALDTPTASLTPANLATVQAMLDAHGAVRERTQIARIVVRTIDAALRGEGAADAAANLETGVAEALTPVQADPLDLSGSGFLRVRLLCGALAKVPSTDASLGTIDLVVPFTNRGLDPVSWGTFHGCRYHRAGHEVTIDRSERDDDVRLHIDGPGLALADAELVFDLQLRVRFDDGPMATVRSAFRSRPGSQRVDQLVEVGPDGATLVVTVPGAGGKKWVDVRANNGNWVCDLANSACTDTATGARLPPP